jgi:hypothetical protein
VLYVAADGDEIRGGAWLREQYFWIDGAQHRVGWIKYPVAESLVDRRYAAVPLSLVRAFVQLQPNLMALGMGGLNAPFARLLNGLGWKMWTVPFLFRVTRPFRVLRRLSYARQRRWMRVAMDLAAWSGAGWAGHRLIQATSYRVRRNSGITVTTEQDFAPWADPLWEACRGDYHALAVKDAKTLDFIYPESFEDLHRLRVARDGADIGWICAQILPAGGGPAAYLGDLRVGMLTDMLALRRDATDVLAVAVRHLEELGVDLIITNLSHEDWVVAARRLRFFSGPSTHGFARAPEAERVVIGDLPESQVHLTRGDGDGPIR